MKGLTLVEVLIYSALFMLILSFLIGILIYYKKVSKTLDTIAQFQMSLQTAINILDYHFTNAGYTSTPEGIPLSKLYFVTESGQISQEEIAQQLRYVQFINNQDRDMIFFYFIETLDHSLAYIKNATNLQGQDLHKIQVSNNFFSNPTDSNNNNIPDVREVWYSPVENNYNFPLYPVIMFCPDSNGKLVGVVFYVTGVIHNQNLILHSPTPKYGNNLNVTIVNKLPQLNNVRLIKVKSLYRCIVFSTPGNELTIMNYTFIPSDPFDMITLLTNVESFNIRLALDSDGDNLVDTTPSGNIDWKNNINSSDLDKVAMIEYTIVVKSRIKNLIGLDRNPLTGVGGDGYKRYLIRRTVTLKNIVNPSI
ncbi:MAG: hypothetical protein ABDH21_00400 [bacterium]